MAVPKQKVSRSKRNMRRAHDALTALNFSKCGSCGAPRLPHSICESCGTYKDRKIPERYLKGDLLRILR